VNYREFKSLDKYKGQARTKSQAPNPKQEPSSKAQIPNKNPITGIIKRQIPRRQILQTGSSPWFPFGICFLSVWSLFGIWCLSFGPSLLFGPCLVFGACRLVLEVAGG
jgi:hypothetical protein